MINRLRDNFKGASKQYLITGAPQCLVPDNNMGQMISQAKFDIIWVQFYNTPACSAMSWVTANPNYASNGVEKPSGFTYNQWESWLAGTQSKDAKLYIGIPGGSGGANPGFYLSPSQAASLAKAYFCKPNFGGIMIWEATYSENNAVFHQSIKNSLVSLSQSSGCKSSGGGSPPPPPPPTTTQVSQPTQPPSGGGGSCKQTYTVVSGDYCYLIWTKYSITEAQLRAWNPSLNAACAVFPGDKLCVSSK
jgi:chitinase